MFAVLPIVWVYIIVDVNKHDDRCSCHHNWFFPSEVVGS